MLLSSISQDIVGLINVLKKKVLDLKLRQTTSFSHTPKYERFGKKKKKNEERKAIFGTNGKKSAAAEKHFCQLLNSHDHFPLSKPGFPMGFL